MVNGGLTQRSANTDATKKTYIARTRESAKKKMARKKFLTGDLRFPAGREVVGFFFSGERFRAIPNNFACRAIRGVCDERTAIIRTSS